MAFGHDIGQPRGGGGVGDVEHLAPSLAIERRDGGGGGVAVHVGGDHDEAATRQLAGDGGTDARSGSGDDGDGIAHDHSSAARRWEIGRSAGSSSR